MHSLVMLGIVPVVFHCGVHRVIVDLRVWFRFFFFQRHDITQVYFCAEAEGVGEGFAIAFIAAQVIAAAIRIKICLCMLMLKMKEMRERAAQSSATNMCRGGCLSRSEFAREGRAPKS